MKKVLFVMAILAIFALPALAQYQGSIDPDHTYWTYQYYNGFENYNAGPLAATNKTGSTFKWGQDGWTAHALTGTYTNLSGNVYSNPSKALAGNNYYQNGPGGSSSIGFANHKALTNFPELGRNTSHLQAYREGFVEFWMYDPKGASTAAGTDSRGWVSSPMFDPKSTTTSSSYTWGATLGDSRTTLGKTHWVFAMGGSFFAADGSGTTAAGGAGGGLVFTSVAGQARQRTIGWHQVQLYWNFTDTQGRLEMYVDDMITPCITADFSSINSRWANMKYVNGIYIGSTQGVITQEARIDDISFYARDAVLTPEPSSLLALGAGAMGLLGLIRRRK